MRVTIALCLIVTACSTPEPSAPPRSAWYARGFEIARTAKDETDLKGRIAIEYVRITDPFGEHARMTRDERAAAIRDLADGWSDGQRRSTK